MLDLADARVLRGVLAGVPLDSEALQEVVQALSQKDGSALAELTRAVPEAEHAGLRALPKLYGGAEVLAAARQALPQRALIAEALDQLQWLASQIYNGPFPALRIGFDLSDMSGYAYYSGPRFAIYGKGSSDALARGGRYDEVGAIFGRNRPAVGFSLDLKSLAEVAGNTPGAGCHPGALGRGSGPARCRAAAARSRGDRSVRAARAAPAGRLRL